MFGRRNKEPKRIEPLEAKLGIGASKRIRSFTMDRDGLSITYAGMPSETSFSLVMKTNGMYADRAYNLYYPIDSSEISVRGTQFNLVEVNQAYIHLKSKGSE